MMIGDKAMKNIFRKSAQKPPSYGKEKMSALYSIPREVWMVDIKKAADYSGELPKKQSEEKN